MTTIPTRRSGAGSPTRRNRHRLTVAGIVAASLGVTGLGSYAVLRTATPDFPLVYSERIDEGVTEAVAIADPATALTFARVDGASGPTVLAVTGYTGGDISGVDISAATGNAFTEPIAAFDELGYAALEDIATDASLPPVTVAASEVLTAVDTHKRHVGTGTNYREHQAESTIDEPFLFPKVGALTDSDEPLLAGTSGLLDYEVELGVVALDDITTETGTPEHMGLVLTNDWTDRELLSSQLEPDDLTAGAGFTNAKSQPGFFSTGDLFVIPADWQTYYQELELDLFVNGDLRQRADPSDMVWDAPTLIEKVLTIGDRTWDSDGVQTSLTAEPGVITRGTVIQSGTPEGVIHRAPDTRQRVLGFMEYAGSLGTNADSVVDSALQVYVREAHEAGVYLKPGDEIVTRSEGLGQIFTPIVPGERSESEDLG
ncbi:fumarylacetoacetate hydrolase family protein [Auraticoccus monumenti]|uniref:2-keto-4-pentenoate hydratase/2-oxohepta-3-ene-1,7-dioic acid hydratase (Catechol pathway) n=1 Tax=Auraticoccus monumenti TaxID=675864 RepID=A0A1G7CA50_9ACTN|nr:fumarylacetoacetate hydrolase family protein [Auraticoccus monumenti]SDE36199.1 2-keto-4-pentenoate hydratase/2-oxohepta-3-ene-1,7-dioic acid hydratase (catechol pathway) [Auraticoccus monumenti]